MIEAVLSNADHPEYGVATIPLPIPRNQYDHCVALLEALEIGGASEADCRLDSLDSACPVLNRLVCTKVNLDELDYEDADYHNAVFVGTDEDGVPRHAHKRSANSFGKAFRLNVEGCDPRHSFHHIGTDGSLYVFEAPIDMLSYITLHPEGWQSHSYVACCGTSIQPVLKLLERQPQINTVLLCLDNDEAGHLASRRMKEQLAERYTVERLIPAHKDWNDDLTAEEPSYAQVMQ